MRESFLGSQRQSTNLGMQQHAWIMVGLVTIITNMTALADPPVVSHDDSFSKEALFKADVSTLKDTQLVIHPDVPLDPSKNVLWCGTMQLAWNKAIDLVGEKLHFTTPSPSADLLNRQDFTDTDLDPASYVALADFEKNNVEDEIRAALEKTFQGSASPELIPPKPSSSGPYDFVAYAYLFKNLSFPKPFLEDSPINFAGTEVTAFGLGHGREDTHLTQDVLNQVLIYDYKTGQDFIIKLKTKSTNDDLILAQVAPQPTLQATIDAVLQRFNNSTPQPANFGDSLAVPLINFDLRRDFSELVGLILQPGPNSRIKSALVIAEAKQLVRFQLNEKGAILKSEAVVLALAGASGYEREMYFDHPFLILMKRKDSKQPYFALWVGNATLLVSAPKQP